MSTQKNGTVKQLHPSLKSNISASKNDDLLHFEQSENVVKFS